MIKLENLNELLEMLLENINELNGVRHKYEWLYNYQQNEKIACKLSVGWRINTKYWYQYGENYNLHSKYLKLARQFHNVTVEVKR